MLDLVKTVRPWLADEREKGTRNLSFDLINLFKLAASFYQKNARSDGVRLNPPAIVDNDSRMGLKRGGLVYTLWKEKRHGPKTISCQFSEISARRDFDDRLVSRVELISGHVGMILGKNWTENWNELINDR